MKDHSLLVLPFLGALWSMAAAVSVCSHSAEQVAEQELQPAEMELAWLLLLLLHPWVYLVYERS